MSRVILFRGRSVKTDQWVYGSLVSYLNPEATPDIYDPGTSQYVSVDPATIGQCTDVMDKNDRYIYEGDIVNKRGMTVDVRYKRGSFTLDHLSHCSTNLGSWHESELEVIGNIYENSDLLSAYETAGAH